MYVCSLCGSQVPKHECKPSLRDRCEKLFSDIMRVEFEKYSDLDMVDIQAIETFAREIRSEALHDAIKAVTTIPKGVTAEHAVTLMQAAERIGKLKDTTTLAVVEDGK